MLLSSAQFRFPVRLTCDGFPSHLGSLLLIFSFLSLLTEWSHSQTVNKLKYLSSQKSFAGNNIDEMVIEDLAKVRSGILVAGNDFYEIVIENTIGAGVGLYTIRTGAHHPVTQQFGSGQDILFGGARGLPGTNYTTIRSYTSKTDYVQTEFARDDSGFTTLWLDLTFINEDSVVNANEFISPITIGADTTGFRVIYSAPGLAVLPDHPFDSLQIVQLINVRGNRFDDSWVEVTTIIKNLDMRPLEIGIRYLWDVIVAGDDGVIMVLFPGNIELGGNEVSLIDLDSFFLAAANEFIDAMPPAYNVFGSLLTPGHLLSAAVRPPERLQQVSWPLAFFKSFEYPVDNSLDVTTENDPNARLTGGDNAIQYFWGSDRPITIEPGDSIQVTQALVASLPGREPSILTPARFLFGLDEDNFKLIKVDVNAAMPTIIELGNVIDAPTGKALREIQAMTWDPVSNRILFISNKDEGRLYKIDPDQIPNIASTGNIPADLVGNLGTTEIEGIAIHPVSGKLFGVDTGRKDKLVTIDKTTGHVTPIGRLGEFNDVEDIAFTLTPEPILYGVDSNKGKLITIDITTGVGTAVNPANTIGFPDIESLEAAPDGRLFGFSEGVTPTFVTIDPESGKGTEFPTSSSRRHDIEALTFMLPTALFASSQKLFTAVENELSLPAEFTLEQNYPNPFNPTTKIRFTIHEGITSTTNVQLHIYNLLGELVRVLVNEPKPPGRYEAEWDGRNELGKHVAAGLYLYSLNANGTRVTKKMMLVR